MAPLFLVFTQLFGCESTQSQNETTGQPVVSGQIKEVSKADPQKAAEHIQQAGQDLAVLSQGTRGCGAGSSGKYCQ